MPTKTKPDPNAVYQCRETISFSAEATLRAGERRRGDDPLVIEHFEHFVADGTPIRSYPQLDPPSEPRVAPEVDTAVYEHLAPFDGLVLRRPVKVLHKKEVREFPAGTIFASDAEIVRSLPDAFEKPSGVKR